MTRRRYIMWEPALIPSKVEIISILDILQDILFPGFFRKAGAYPARQWSITWAPK